MCAFEIRVYLPWGKYLGPWDTFTFQLVKWAKHFLELAFLVNHSLLCDIPSRWWQLFKLKKKSRRRPYTSKRLCLEQKTVSLSCLSQDLNKKKEASYFALLEFKVLNHFLTETHWTARLENNCIPTIAFELRSTQWGKVEKNQEGWKKVEFQHCGSVSLVEFFWEIGERSQHNQFLYLKIQKRCCYCCICVASNLSDHARGKYTGFKMEEK